jgi:hypothetical protein
LDHPEKAVFPYQWANHLVAIAKKVKHILKKWPWKRGHEPLKEGLFVKFVPRLQEVLDFGGYVEQFKTIVLMLLESQEDILKSGETAFRHKQMGAQSLRSKVRQASAESQDFKYTILRLSLTQNKI